MTIVRLKPVKAVTTSTVAELMMADLARSGLDGKDAKSMGVAPLTPEMTARMTQDKFAVSAYMIPYHTSSGLEAGFLRLRFLAPVKMKGENKEIRYWQPPGTLPKVYFPKLGVTKWTKVLADTSKPIYITEGEKKAAVACKAGLATLGLGGVWSWRSSKFGKLLLDELEAIDWNGREVIVVFDSDLADNPNVQAALTQMGRVLLDRGAVVSSVSLTPLDDGSKAGLDDWIVARGVDAFKELEPEPLSESVELWRLNEEVALIRDNGGIVEIGTFNVYSKSMFCETIYANRRFVRVTGEGKLKECSAPEEWMRWKNRREYQSLTYAPGDGQVTSKNELNLWKGWGAEPKKGNVKPFTDVLNFIFKGDRDAQQWFLQWCAYPIQNPGTKLYTSVLIHGLTHGTGKSLIGYMLGIVYGDNFGVIGQEDLESQFNDWGKGKQFVLGEEVTSSDRRRDSDKLKFMTTRTTVSINVKYQPRYELPDYVNYLFTSNHPDAFFVEPSDRRLFIWEAPRNTSDPGLYTRADDWMHSKGGASALLYYLLNEVDCRGFNPKGHAPGSASKNAMVELSASDLDIYARSVMEDPEGTLTSLGPRAKSCDLFTIDELLEVFDPGQMRRTTKIAMAKALRRAGALPMEPTTTRVGTKKLYAVRNEETWAKSSHGQRDTHYTNSITAAKRVPKSSKRKGAK